MLHEKHKYLGGIFVFLCFAGLFVAGTLAIGEFLNLSVPCGESSGCDEVATHPASRVLGIPISYLGVAVYLFVAILAWRQGAPLVLLAVTGVGVASSGYLLFLSLRVIEATCVWCLASAAIMALLFVLALVTVLTRARLTFPPPLLSWPLAVLLVGALGVQTHFIRKSGTRSPISEQKLIAVGVERLTASANVLGPPDAPVTIIQFANFTCGGCRTAHDSIRRYRANNVNAVRLVYRHRPLTELRGHELSGDLAAMSEIAAEGGRFWDFADAVYSREKWTLDEIFDVMKSLGFERGEVEKRIRRQEDPAVLRVSADKEFAEELGVMGTPTFVVILSGHPPKSATGHGLEDLLNSEAVIESLKAAR